VLTVGVPRALSVYDQAIRLIRACFELGWLRLVQKRQALPPLIPAPGIAKLTHLNYPGLERSDMKSTSRAAVALCALLFLAGQVKASPILFTASGSFTDGSTLSGTITIDPTSEIATEMDLFLKGGTAGYVGTLEFKASPPANPPTPPQDAGEVWFQASDSNSDFLQISILGSDLMGYAGGPLSLVPTSSQGDGTYFYLKGDEGSGNLEVGSLTPSITTPQPTSMTLLTSGFLAAGGFHFIRRRRKSGPVC
jgi:hypothetical protein